MSSSPPTVLHISGKKTTGKTTLADRITSGNYRKPFPSDKDYVWYVYTKPNAEGTKVWMKFRELLVLLNPEESMSLGYANNLKETVYRKLLSSGSRCANNWSLPYLACIPLMITVIFSVEAIFIPPNLKYFPVLLFGIWTLMSLIGDHPLWGTETRETLEAQKDSLKVRYYDFDHSLTTRTSWYDFGFRYQTVRKYLIEFGMKKREENEHYWVDVVINTIKMYPHKLFLIMDYRFENELNRCRELLPNRDHISICLYRPLVHFIEKIPKNNTNNNSSRWSNILSWVLPVFYRKQDSSSLRTSADISETSLDHIQADMFFWNQKETRPTHDLYKDYIYRGELILTN
jgi:hypothetical protein